LGVFVGELYVVALATTLSVKLDITVYVGRIEGEVAGVLLATIELLAAFVSLPTELPDAACELLRVVVLL
jgi:hypothetical protein